MTRKEKAKKLHEIADALEEWGKYNEKVTNAAEWGTPEAKQIIRKAMTLLVDNLVLLNECKNKYGCHSPLQQCFVAIEQAASRPKTKDLGDCRAWTRDFTESHLWGGEKRSLADECVRFAKEVNKETEQGNKGTKKGREGLVEPKPPEILAKILWIWKYGRQHWKLVCVGILVLLISCMFALPKFNLFGNKYQGTHIETENKLHKPIVLASANVEVTIESDEDIDGIHHARAYLVFGKGKKSLLKTSSIGYEARQRGNGNVIYKGKFEMDATDSVAGRPVSFLKDAEFIQIQFGGMPLNSTVLGGHAICLINDSVRLEFSIPPQTLVNNRIFIRNLSDSMQVLNEPSM